MNQFATIELPPPIHSIVQRWSVFFSMMEDQGQSGDDQSPQTVLQRLADASHPPATRREVNTLALFVLVLLGAHPNMAPHMKTEALELATWMVEIALATR